MTENEDVTESIFVGINMNGLVVVKAHLHARFTNKTATSSDLSNVKRKQNDRMIPCHVLYAQELKQKEVYNDLALFFSSTYIIKMPGEREPTVMDPIVSSINTGNSPKSISAAFIK